MSLWNLRSGRSFLSRGKEHRRYLVVLVPLVVAVAAVSLAYLLLSSAMGVQDNNVLVVEITAYQWGFNVTSAPDSIEYERKPHGDLLRIPLGSTVRFKVFAQTDKDQDRRQHGFVIAGMGVVETLNVGTTTEIEVLFDREGTFSYFCNQYCGLDHDDMEGVIIVEGA